MSPRTRMSAALAALILGTLALAGAGTSASKATRSVLYGVNDDAWLLHGPGSLESRLDELDRLGTDVVRFTIRWDRVARTRPSSPRDHTDRAYDWDSADAVLRGLRRHRIEPVITLFGTPGWANDDRSANWAPTAGTSFGNFTHAAARRYSWIRYWTIWNEPNRSTFLRPTNAKTYVEMLLNPAYAQLHAVIDGVKVGGGVTAPRAGASGTAPVPWIRAMGAAGAKLDAYAHHPYPGRPQLETPWGPKCASCNTIAMADLERLEREVASAFGRKRIWLTEYGYQTNPPDLFLGVSNEQQATYVVSAAMRAYRAASVEMLIYFMVRDDAQPAGWQSGVFTEEGRVKPSYAAFRLPLLQTARRGANVELWGQVRPRSGRQPFRIRLEADDVASWIGGTRQTDANGFFTVTIPAPAGSLVRIWSPRDGAYGHEIVAR
jgi:Glycosyl hydrolase catalytic core